jgi:WXG100 family type VII secretion target
MASISKEEQALTRGAQMVQSARGDLTSQLNALRGQIAPLQTSWQGSGGASFANVMRRWDEDSAKIISALDEFEANLRASDQTYNAADEEQAANLGRLNSRLG